MLTGRNPRWTAGTSATTTTSAPSTFSTASPTRPLAREMVLACEQAEARRGATTNGRRLGDRRHERRTVVVQCSTSRANQAAGFCFPDGRRPRKRCNECGGIFDVEAGFARAGHAKDSSGLLYIYSRPVCIGCEQGQRDRAKAENRWRIKARDTLRRHSAKFNVTRNLSLSTDEFSDRFVWRIERIAHDMSHAFENTCNYCWKPYGEMFNGHWNVTVDIYDRGADPFYSNTRICCRTFQPRKRTNDA